MPYLRRVLPGYHCSMQAQRSGSHGAPPAYGLHQVPLGTHHELEPFDGHVQLDLPLPQAKAKAEDVRRTCGAGARKHSRARQAAPVRRPTIFCGGCCGRSCNRQESASRRMASKAARARVRRRLNRHRKNAVPTRTLYAPHGTTPTVDGFISAGEYDDVCHTGLEPQASGLEPQLTLSLTLNRPLPSRRRMRPSRHQARAAPTSGVRSSPR